MGFTSKHFEIQRSVRLLCRVPPLRGFIAFWKQPDPSESKHLLCSVYPQSCLYGIPDNQDSLSVERTTRSARYCLVCIGHIKKIKYSWERGKCQAQQNCAQPTTMSPSNAKRGHKPLISLSDSSASTHIVHPSAISASFCYSLDCARLQFHQPAHYCLIRLTASINSSITIPTQRKDGVTRASRVKERQGQPTMRPRNPM